MFSPPRLSRGSKTIDINVSGSAKDESAQQLDSTTNEQGGNEPLDLSRIAPALQELAKLLIANDTQAGVFLKNIFTQGYPQEVDENLRRLEKSLAGYDFDEARDILSGIAKKTGIDLSGA